MSAGFWCSAHLGDTFPEFNNARLVAIATYERCVPALRSELDRLGTDLQAFYAAMRELAGRPQARAKLCPGPSRGGAIG